MQTPAFAATKTARTWKLFRGMIWVAAVMAACLCPTLAFGQTNSSWNGGTGNWNNATDWTPNQVPNNGGGNTYNVTIDSGGTDVVTLNQSATINSLVLGGLTGSASLDNLSGTAENLNVTGALSINQTGTLTFDNGSTVAIGGNGANAGLIDLEGGSTLTVSGNFTNSLEIFTNLEGQPHPKSDTITVTGTFTNVPGASLSIGDLNAPSVANVGQLVNEGDIDVGPNATLNLTNEPNGITDVVAGSRLELLGTIKAGSANGLANLESIEGRLDLFNGQTTTVTPGSGTLSVSSGGLLRIFFGTLIVDGNLTNSGLVQTPGAGILTSMLTVTGTFTNAAGADATIIGFSGTSPVWSFGTLFNNGVVNITSGTTLNLTNSGGSFVQTSGVTIVNGTLNSVPAVQIQGGTLSGSGTINGNVIMGGTISPGNSPGILTINGNYTQAAFGAYVAELAGLTAGTGYDQVDVNGTANLDGTLDVSLINGFTVALGDNFILMKYDSETGTFSMVDLPKLGNGLMWDLSYDPGFIDLSVTSGVTTTPEPSTYLLWGAVGLLGIGIWGRRKFRREMSSSE